MGTPSKQTDCCGGSGLMSVDDARERIMALAKPLEEEETVDIRTALGRVLCENVISRFDIPPYRNSAMDGYAVSAADLPETDAASLTVVGTSMAGAPFTGAVNARECVRIMTGAVVPENTDTVIMQERVTRDGDSISIGSGHHPGENVRHPGEDIKTGQTVLDPGNRLMPADLGILASVGIDKVKVKRRLKAAFFSTGDELRPVGEPLAEGQIYDSNRYTLHGMLSRLNIELVDLGVIPDDRAATEKAFLDAAAQADVVLTSGGVSVGEADYVKETLDKLGNVDFWRIAMKPGKPVAFGKVKNTLFFGLPGNPVSVMATFYQFVQPALEALMGMASKAPLIFKVPAASTLKKSPGRTDFQRGVLARDSAGILTVSGTGGQGSHILTSMSRANCFIILPADCAGVSVGEMVDVQPFDGLV